MPKSRPPRVRFEGRVYILAPHRHATYRPVDVVRATPDDASEPLRLRAAIQSALDLRSGLNGWHVLQSEDVRSILQSALDRELSVAEGEGHGPRESKETAAGNADADASGTVEVGPGARDELLEFLSAFFYIYPNLNDTFGYACADTERIALEVEEPFGPDETGYVTNGEVLVKVWREYGHAGIRAFVASMRGKEPLPQLQSDEYRAARVALEGWTYDPD